MTQTTSPSEISVQMLPGVLQKQLIHFMALPRDALDDLESMFGALAYSLVGWNSPFVEYFNTQLEKILEEAPVAPCGIGCPTSCIITHRSEDPAVEFGMAREEQFTEAAETLETRSMCRWGLLGTLFMFETFFAKTKPPGKQVSRKRFLEALQEDHEDAKTSHHLLCILTGAGARIGLLYVSGHSYPPFAGFVAYRRHSVTSSTVWN